MSDTPKPPSFYDQLASGNALGLLVYRSFNPQNPGVIVESIDETQRKTGEPAHDMLYKVRWLRGKKDTTVESRYRLRSFLELISDHKRKYDKQSQDAFALKKMFVELRKEGLENNEQCEEQ